MPVTKDGSVELTFKVKIQELENGTKIENTGTYKDVTITNEIEEKETNKVELMYFNTYGEEIVSQRKVQETEYGENYVVEGEKIKYKILINNIGILPEKVIVKDTIPEGTTFIENSIQVNGSPYAKEDGTAYTEEDLKNGIELAVPAGATDYES